MKKFLIEPNSLIGYCYLKGSKFTAAEDCFNSEFEAHLHIQSKESEKNQLLRHSFFYMCSDNAKKKIENSNLSGIRFRNFDKIVREYLAEFPERTKEFNTINDNSWWIICNNISNEEPDFYQYKYNLILSEEAYRFVLEQNIFSTVTIGKEFGEVYQVCINSFLVKGDLDNFLLHEMPKNRKKIEEVRDRIMVEYRRRNGLPPLH